MGTWGTGILHDDFACDIYQEYLALWDEGVQTPEAIRAGLQTQYEEFLDEDEEGPLFWLALARAQWECGVLEQDVLDQVEAIVAGGADLERWEDAFDPADRNRRRAVLRRFRKTLDAPPTRPRNRPRRHRRWTAPFAPGDCLAVALTDGDWGAALVLATDEDGRQNLVGVLRYKSAARPTLDDFARREWLVLTHHSWDGRLEIQWCDARYFKSTAPALEVVGQIPLTNADPKDCPVFGGWALGLQIESQFAWEREQRDP